MNVAGYIFAALAAVVHVYIFVLESILWTAPKTRATFGVKSEEEALTTKPLAFNQGFYNLFLAIVSVIGISSGVVTIATPVRSGSSRMSSIHWV